MISKVKRDARNNSKNLNKYTIIQPKHCIKNQYDINNYLVFYLFNKTKTFGTHKTHYTTE